MRGRSLPEREYKLKAIIYPAHVTHYRLCIVDGNKAQLTQYLNEITEYDDTTLSETQSRKLISIKYIFLVSISIMEPGKVVMLNFSDM